jgi:hypothetical protein
MESKKFEVDVIPRDAITTVEISGYFYERLSNHVMHYLSKFTEEEISKFYQMISDNTAHLNPDAYNLQTLFTLLHDLEEKFDADGVIKKDTLIVNEEDQLDNDSKTED